MKQAQSISLINTLPCTLISSVWRLCRLGGAIKEKSSSKGKCQTHSVLWKIAEAMRFNRRSRALVSESPGIRLLLACLRAFDVYVACNTMLGDTLPSHSSYDVSIFESVTVSWQIFIILAAFSISCGNKRIRIVKCMGLVLDSLKYGNPSVWSLENEWVRFTASRGCAEHWLWWHM